ncbi:hypothetical protein HPT25_07330 [Bacillus sp. BRMEA1]|uniref:hypothetical protein n=1 Tax=Neobacillus endophyticus TaxID=2738405 RepID=UPI0015640900|nr:hypothetical protein [Neobacillus endophyticus]NRD77309.1 hypothetical protein [Neobacillus endophyticus]
MSGLTAVANTNNTEFRVKLASVTFTPAGGSAAALVANAGYSFTLGSTSFTGVSNNLGLTSQSGSITRGTDVLTTTQSVNTVLAVSNTPSQVKVVFNQPVDGATATNIANYSINGLTITNAVVKSGEPNNVYLTLASGTNTLSGARQITINGVKTANGAGMTQAYVGSVGLNENVAPTFTASLVSPTSIKLTFSANVEDTTNGITLGDLKVTYGGTDLTETGASPQVLGVYADAGLTQPITSASATSYGTVYVKLASGTVTDLTKALTVTPEGTTVTDTLGNVWATNTVTVQ